MKHKRIVTSPRLLIVASFSLLLAASTNAFAVDTTLLNGTSWRVGEFVETNSGICTGPAHPVPWTFQKTGTVSAGNLWQGTWKDTGDRIRVTIKNKDGSTADAFDVVFLTSNAFVAVKGRNALYRFGTRSS